MARPKDAEPEAINFPEPNKNVQEFYLNTLRKRRQRVTILLTNGTRFDGVISSFDVHTLMLKAEQGIVLYKQMIAIVSPQTSKPRQKSGMSFSPPLETTSSESQIAARPVQKTAPKIMVRQKRTIIKPQ
jgi:host factor-I protein